MTGLDEFLAMGGYAAFVWPAYGVAALVLLVLAAVSVRSYRARQSAVRTLQQQLRAPDAGAGG